MSPRRTIDISTLSIDNRDGILLIASEIIRACRDNDFRLITQGTLPGSSA